PRDWSSDVCSSDLAPAHPSPPRDLLPSSDLVLHWFQPGVQFLQSKLETRLHRSQRVFGAGCDLAMTHSPKKRQLQCLTLKLRQGGHLFAQVTAQIGSFHFLVAIYCRTGTTGQFVYLLLIAIFYSNVGLPPAQPINRAPPCNGR